MPSRQRPEARPEVTTVRKPALLPSSVTTSERDQSTLVLPWALKGAQPQPLPILLPQTEFLSLDFQNTLGILQCLVSLRPSPLIQDWALAMFIWEKPKHLHVTCPP